MPYDYAPLPGPDCIYLQYIRERAGEPDRLRELYFPNPVTTWTTRRWLGTPKLESNTTYAPSPEIQARGVLQ
jgi:hypothetical protein